MTNWALYAAAVLTWGTTWFAINFQLGVVGPTRMDYPGTMGSVRAVARYVGRILTEQG